MLTLFKTLLEIIFLRKGPNDIPASSVLFVVIAALWFFVGAVTVMVIDTYKSADFLIDLVLAFVALGFYAVIINVFGKSDRLMRCVAAILGCGVVFSVVLLASRLVLPQLLGDNEVNWIVQLIWFWSIPVEGHIIARTIDRQWYFGFMIALTVLFGQLQLFFVLKPMLGPVA